MHPAGGGIDLVAQRDDVGGKKFGKFALPADQFHHRMLAGQAVEHIRGGGKFSGRGFAGFVGRLQLQLPEQHVGQLLCGIEVERPADERMHFDFDFLQFGLEIIAQFREVGQIQGDSFPLHRGQDRDERHLHFLEQLCLAAALEFLPQRGDQPERDVRVGGGIGRRMGRVHAVHGDLFRALADQRLDRRHLHPQPHETEILQSEAARGGIAQPFGDHRIKGRRGDRQARARKNREVVFDIVAGFRNPAVGQHCAKHVFYGAEVEVRAIPMADRQVVSFALRDRERDPDQFGAHRIGGGGFGIQRQDRRAGDFFREIRQLLFIVDQLPAARFRARSFRGEHPELDAGGRGSRCRQARKQHAEFEGLEQRGDFFTGELTHPAGFKRQPDRGVGIGWSPGCAKEARFPVRRPAWRASGPGCFPDSA